MKSSIKIGNKDSREHTLDEPADTKEQSLPPLTFDRNLFLQCLHEPHNFKLFLDGQERQLKANEDGGAVIASGGSKTLYSFDDTVIYQPSYDVIYMQNEKIAADQVASLNIKTNNYKISELKIVRLVDNTAISCRILSAPSFKARADQENISIIELKKRELAAGMPINIKEEDVKNTNWIKSFLNDLTHEITIALAYGVPLKGDTLNFYFQHASDNQFQSLHLFLFDFSSKYDHEIETSYILREPVLPNKEAILAIIYDTLRNVNCYFNTDIRNIFKQESVLISEMVDEALSAVRDRLVSLDASRSPLRQSKDESTKQRLDSVTLYLANDPFTDDKAIFQPQIEEQFSTKLLSDKLEKVKSDSEDSDSNYSISDNYFTPNYSSEKPDVGTGNKNNETASRSAHLKN